MAKIAPIEDATTKESAVEGDGTEYQKNYTIAELMAAQGEQ